jgi:hypothetical protein
MNQPITVASGIFRSGYTFLRLMIATDCDKILRHMTLKWQTGEKVGKVRIAGSSRA